MSEKVTSSKQQKQQQKQQQTPRPAHSNNNDTSVTSSLFSDLYDSRTAGTTTRMTQQQQSQQQQQAQQQQQRPPLHVVFIHLDWGIGGAEQLMLQLATASQAAGHRLSLITTRCEPHHCFAALKPETETDTGTDTGTLYPYLHIWGSWIPTHIGGGWRHGASASAGKFQAACSTIRLLYLAYRVAKRYRQSQTPDLIVLDVLPTPLFILRWFTPAALLYYCHFPDQLLLRQDSSKEEEDAEKKTRGLLLHIRRLLQTTLKTWYRAVLNRLEEACMQLADVTCVNSQFTKQTVLATFPALATATATAASGDSDDANSDNNDSDLYVLYPALDMASLDAAAAAAASEQQKPSESADNNNNNKLMIVSLNRYERKKNLELLIQAAAWFQPKLSAKQKQQGVVHIVIAGGYDTKNTENVEYYQELIALAQELQVPIDFRRSVSDTERNTLLQQATVVVYTPSREHFGIVPLEAMYAGTPVVAVRSGGPMETIVDGKTGYLCEPTAASFGDALLQLLQDPVRARTMGIAAKQHVLQNFSDTKLRQEWNALVQATVMKGHERVSRHAWYYRRTKTVLYVMEAILTLLLYWMLSWLLKNVGILQEPTGAVWDSLTGWLIRWRRQQHGGVGGDREL